MAEDQPPRVIYTFAKNSRESVQAALKRFNGRDFADLRLHYWSEAGPEEALAPTRKGLTLRLDLLPELKKAVDALCAAAEGAR